MVARHIAGLEMHLGSAVIVAGDEAVEDFGKKAPLLRPEPPHDAEVDRDQLAAIVHEQVARMHVGVEEAVAQRVAQKSLNHRAGEVLEIEALGFELCTVGERHRFDPFEREHVARDALPVERRHAKLGVVLGVLRHLGEGGGFQPQIHLDGDRAPQRLDHLDQAQPPRLGGKFFRVARREGESIEINLEAALDARAEHLHRDRAAWHSIPLIPAQAGIQGHLLDRYWRPWVPAFAGTSGCLRVRFHHLGPMHLRDRSGGDGRAETREHLAQRLAEGGLDRALGLGLRERRHLVLQGFEVARERHADHVRARC